MTFQNYNIADNAYGILEFDIADTDTTINLSEQYNLPTSNFICTLQSKDSQGNLTAREKILVSSRTSLTLTVDTRGFDGTSPLSFSAGDEVALLVEKAVLNDIKDSVDDILNNTIDINGTKTFTNFPTTPNTSPTADYEVANKKYVDDNGGGAVDSVNGYTGAVDLDSDYLAKDNTNTYSPSANYHPATKKYVDDSVSAAGGGDMLKTTYDSDDNGIVDNSEALEGQIGSYYLDRTNHTGSVSIDTNSDVDITTTAPTDGQGLIWDNVNSKFIPGDVGTGGGTSLSDSYTTSNVVTDRTLDANNTSINELADVVGTVIEDMQQYAGTSYINDGSISTNTTYSSDKITTDFEQLSNKSTDTNLGTSDTLYPSQNAVKSYVDSNAAGGSSIYAVVDSSGNGDYTTVTDAINADEGNIYVKNGTYTEDEWNLQNDSVRIVCESQEVEFTFNNTNTHANNAYVDFGSSAEGSIYIEGGLFNITLNNTNDTFVTGNTNNLEGYIWEQSKFIVDNADTDDQVFTDAYTYEHGFFSCRWVLQNEGKYPLILANTPVNFTDCSFEQGEIVIGNNGVYRNCSTSDVTGIGFDGGTYYNCFLGGTTSCDTLYNSFGSTTGGLSDINGLYNTRLGLWSVSNSCDYIRINSSSDSKIDSSDFGFYLVLESSNGDKGVGHCNDDLQVYGDIQLKGRIANCDINSTTSNVVINSSNTTVTGCNLYAGNIITITDSANRCAITGNYFGGNKLIISTGCDKNVVTGNTWADDITDDGTGNIVANNGA